MEEKFNNLKEEYKKQKAPVELERIIQMEIEKDKIKSKKKQQWKAPKRFLATAAAFALIFTGIVNSSLEVAMAMYQVPVLGNLAKLVTFREYHFENEKLNVDVKVPSLTGTGNKDLEERVQTEITKKVDEVMAQSKQESDAYNKQVRKEEGRENESWQFDVTVDYEKKYADEKWVSFVVYKLVNGPSADPENYYYNVDMETGKNLKLSDCLGEGYEQLVNESIHKQIQERMASDENQIFFGFSQDDKEMGMEGFQGVTNDQSFYMNEKGNVVVAFAKYQIAPGYMGMPEFEIGPIIK